MSFILDALKKSEAERKRQDAPGLASIPAAKQDSSSSKWIWIIAGLLTVNVVVLTVVVLKPWGETLSETTPQPQAGAIERPVQTAPEPVSRSAATGGESVATAALQPATDPVDAAPAATVAIADNTPPAPVSRTGPAEPSSLPTFDELRSAGRLQLPDLHVDIHVYSGQPADRFVFVNMTKYRENAKLTEGPVVTRITPDGVELDYLGTAFLLPRE